MYVPPLFALSDAKDLRDFCAANPFALLVSHDEDGLFATHLPVVIKDHDGALAFHGHIARANPHWQKAATGAKALLVFSGPQAYVTPSWYASKKEHGKVVPTWNYMAVHAHGRLTWSTDNDFLHANLDDLTQAHEAHRAHPWAMSDAPDDFVALQMRAIVGLRFDVERLDGKAKLSQNRPAADIDGVVAGYGTSADPMERMVGDLVAQHRKR